MSDQKVTTLNLFIAGLNYTADYNGLKAYADLYGGVCAGWNDDLYQIVMAKDNDPTSTVGLKINIVAHSYGCQAAADLLDKLKKLPQIEVGVVVFIDGVRYQAAGWISWLINIFDWFTPFDIQAQTKVSLQKTWGLPPSVPIKGVKSIVIPGADHANAPRSAQVAAAIDKYLSPRI